MIGRAGKIEVADRVEDLVAHELVRIAQAGVVQHLGAADHHRIVERAAEQQARRAQRGHFVLEAEGAGAGDFLLERAVDQFHRVGLACHRGRREGDVEGQREHLRRLTAGRSGASSRTSTGFLILIAMRGAACSRMPAHSIRNANGAALPSMMGISGPLISTRALSMPRPAKAAIRCSMVRIETPCVIGDGRAQEGVGDAAEIRGDHRLLAGNIGALEPDARAGFGREDRHGYLGAGMKADAGAADGILEGFLFEHGTHDFQPVVILRRDKGVRGTPLKRGPKGRLPISLETPQINICFRMLRAGPQENQGVRPG